MRLLVKKKPFLTPEDAKNRLHFARKYFKKTDNFWSKVIFTDETKHDLSKL